MGAYPIWKRQNWRTHAHAVRDVQSRRGMRETRIALLRRHRNNSYGKGLAYSLLASDGDIASRLEDAPAVGQQGRLVGLVVVHCCQIRSRDRLKWDRPLRRAADSAKYKESSRQHSHLCTGKAYSSRSSRGSACVNAGLLSGRARRGAQACRGASCSAENRRNPPSYGATWSSLEVPRYR